MAVKQKAQPTPQPTPPQSMKRQAPATESRGAPPPSEIAARAYEIWQESGRPEGQHEDHWYRAERELRGQSKGATKH